MGKRIDIKRGIMFMKEFLESKENAKEFINKNTLNEFLSVNKEKLLKAIIGTFKWCTLYTSEPLSRLDIKEGLVSLSHNGITVSSKSFSLEIELNDSYNYSIEHVNKNMFIYIISDKQENWTFKIGKEVK